MTPAERDEARRKKAREVIEARKKRRQTLFEHLLTSG